MRYGLVSEESLRDPVIIWQLGNHHSLGSQEIYLFDPVGPAETFIGGAQEFISSLSQCPELQHLQVHESDSHVSSEVVVTVVDTGHELVGLAGTCLGQNVSKEKMVSSGL